jgi:uncharacterized caspase-like protein
MSGRGGLRVISINWSCTIDRVAHRLREAVMGVSRAFTRPACGTWVIAVLFLGLAPIALAQQRTLNIAPAVPTEQRVALVIGNSSYTEARLKNPMNDATDIAKALREIGFQVTLKLDADRRQMRAAIRDFALALKRGGVGLFYFAGHGILSKGKNYLLPVAADVREEFDLEDQAIDGNTVLLGMEEAGNRVNIVILDACRNNPFARSWRSAASGGLAQMNAPTGSFIAFATSPNSVASDGTERNGIFTKHLLANLRQGESDIDRVFTRVTAGVARETGNRQVPWKSSSLTGVFQFREGELTSAGASAAERASWDMVRTSTNPADYQAYLANYPNGYYSELAKAAMVKLQTDLQLREEERKRLEADKAKLEEERRSQQARLKEERRAHEQRLEQDRRKARDREQELARQKREAEGKQKSTIFVPPTF